MLTVTLVESAGMEHVLQVEAGTNVMQAAIDHGVAGILADCGGCCSCATCHCYVDEAWRDRFAAPSEAESELVSYAFDPLPNSRLACQLVLQSDHDGLVIRLPARQI